MNWIRAFVDRPIATILLTVAIVAAGIFGYAQLPVAALPQVDFPTIQISASLPGANPATMASAVATPIERQLSTIAGIDQITSSSSTGSTSVTVQFALNRNIDAAALDVQSALSAVARKLPIEMTTPPSFQKVNPSDQSILVMALRDPTMRLSDLQTIADTTIIPRISTLEGVAQVDVFGTRKFAVRIQFDPTKLSARGLTAEDVRAAVAAANSNTAVGLIGNGPRNYILDATGTIKHAADFMGIVIAYKDGLPVRLGDIATAIDSVENLRGAAKFNGAPGLAMGIKRQPGANVVAMADRVEALLPAIREGLPANTHFDIIVDRSLSIRNSVSDAQVTLIGTAVLVVLVIFLVLGDARATVIPAIVLPVAAVGTFAGMFLAGFSLDNLSLLALTLATGFVVDDAIVVLENIVRHVENGETPRVGGGDGDEGNRLHRRLDLGQPRRGVHPAAVHGRGHRPPVPRVRGDDDDRHRRVGGDRADAGADDRVAGAEGRTRDAGARRALVDAQLRPRPGRLWPGARLGAGPLAHRPDPDRRVDRRRDLGLRRDPQGLLPDRGYRQHVRRRRGRARCRLSDAAGEAGRGGEDHPRRPGDRAGQFLHRHRRPGRGASSRR